MQQTILEKKNKEEVILSSGELLDHWQGHRRLTRRLIESFPEKELFSYSIGGMRPFAELVIEMLDMTVPGINGVLTGKWQAFGDGNTKPATKEELLVQWDDATEKLNAVWPQIPASRFRENDVAFGQYEGLIHSFIFYFIDNEIHHRGQGYVYLRSLGIEPPAFWDRS